MAENVNNVTRGWVSSPDGRGTWDIVWPCVVTIFLCCWTSVCVNAPSLSDGFWARFRSKFDLACLGMLGPEFVVVLALGQWERARQSVSKFKSDGYTGWTMTHAFFADMGGFVLQTRGWVTFPLDAEQLYYLVSKGYLDYPKIDEATLSEKNRSDGLARIVTLLQVLWFSTTCIIRAIQQLDLATIEITTLGFILCTIVTSIAWRQKPSDMERPLILYTNATISDILLNAGEPAKHPYSRTPLDFVSRKESFIGRFWTYDIQILRLMRLSLFEKEVKVRPMNRIPSINWPVLSKPAAIWGLFICLLYNSVYFLGWNLYFPSYAELVLWRVSSVVGMLYPLAMAPVGYYLDYTPSSPWLTKAMSSLTRRPTARDCDLSLSNPRRHRLRDIWNKTSRSLIRFRNISPNHDPLADIPIRLLVPGMISSAIYFLARLYVLVEDLAGLRAVSASTYRTVEYSKYLHIL